MFSLAELEAMENPPYYQAKPYVEHGYRVHHEGGFLPAFKAFFTLNNETAGNLVETASFAYFFYILLRINSPEGDEEYGKVKDSFHLEILFWTTLWTVVSFFSVMLSHWTNSHS